MSLELPVPQWGITQENYREELPRTVSDLTINDAITY